MLRFLLLLLWPWVPLRLQPFALWLLHAKSTIGVLALILEGDERIVLVEHPAKRPRWQLPGGHLKPSEAPESGLRREVFEETGLRVTRCRLVHAERARWRYLVLFYHAEVCGTFRPSVEVRAWQSVSLAALDTVAPDLPAAQRHAIGCLAADMAAAVDRA
jgi:8-oxo-dGTP pyrophosphatase MutT (NUDIX family)